MFLPYSHVPFVTFLCCESKESRLPIPGSTDQTARCHPLTSQSTAVLTPGPQLTRTGRVPITQMDMWKVTEKLSELFSVRISRGWHTRARLQAKRSCDVCSWRHWRGVLSHLWGEKDRQLGIKWRTRCTRMVKDYYKTTLHFAIAALWWSLGFRKKKDPFVNALRGSQPNVFRHSSKSCY